MRDHAVAALDGNLRDLLRWMTIPSVSSDPRRADDVRRAAGWLAARLRSGGADVRLRGAATAPVVVATFAARHRNAPTVLVYGHYDVQPAGPGWSSDPFVPVVRDGRVVGRGASDDKGQLLVHVAAIEAWLRGGGLPVHVVVVAEGAEEVGSPGLREVLIGLRPDVRPALVVVSDTRRRSRDRPAITVSQRGSLTLDLVVDTGGSAVHPGRWGGAVVDPSLVLARALARVDEAIHREIPCAAARPRVSSLPDVSVRASVRPRATWPDALDERMTRRPSLHVTRLGAGAAVAAVPTRATARLDVRIPPDVLPAAAIDVVRRALDGVAPAGVVVRAIRRGAAAGIEMRHRRSTLRAADLACRAGFGAPPALVRSGGSLPAAAILREAFGTAPLLLGLGPEDDGAHGPDEYLDVAGFRRGVLTSTALLGAAAALLPPAPRGGKHARIGGRVPSQHGSGASAQGRVLPPPSPRTSALTPARGRRG